MQKQLLNATNALYYVLSHLKGKGYKFAEVRKINNNRYLWVRGMPNFENVLIVFKKQPFMSFGKIFNLSNQIGETINKEHLQFCAKMEYYQELEKKNTKTYIIYEDGKIYTVPLSEWITSPYERTNEAESSPQSKEQKCLPITNLRRVNV